MTSAGGRVDRTGSPGRFAVPACVAGLARAAGAHVDVYSTCAVSIG